VGMDDPQIPRDPSEFILALHSMIDAAYNLWGSGISYAEWLLEGLEYDEFNITRLVPSLTTQVYAETLFLLLSFSLLVMTTDTGNCNRGDLLLVSPLILHTSLGQSMLMARMALLESASCPVILMSWAIPSLPALER